MIRNDRNPICVALYFAEAEGNGTIEPADVEGEVLPAGIRAHPGRGTLRVGLENAIAPLLPHGRARANDVAHRLGLSPRTLARRLASEGLTFEGILSELRADLAKRYLQDEALTISQIAWLVGYKEVSAFSHAFKRWTGETPAEARAQLGRPELPSG